MAKMAGNIEFTGSLGGFTAYRMKGCDKIVIRRTAGPSKHRINTDPSYVRTKGNKEEFKGVAKAAKHMRYAFDWLERVADYNFQPTLNKVTKAIQKMHYGAEHGKRNILYSQNHDMLKGFNLNKYHLFDSIVRKPVTCTIDSETSSAVVTIPSLKRGINLNLPWPTPQFRFVATLGICDDLLHDGREYDEHSMSDAQSVMVETAWQPANKPYAGEEIKLQIKHTGCSAEHSSLVVCIGIVFDMSHRSFGTRDEIQNPTGSAKVLDLAKATPAPHARLELPFTIKDPETVRPEQENNGVNAPEEEQPGFLSEGFELKDEVTSQDGLPYTFSAAINVDSHRLWQTFQKMAESLPDEGVQLVIGMKGVEPVNTNAIAKQKILESLPPYARELSYDTNISFGLLFHARGSFVELMVTECKYLRFRGINKEKFLQTMGDLNLHAVEQLRFIDQYPLETRPLRKFLPEARLPETVIQELMEVLSGGVTDNSDTFK